MNRIQFLTSSYEALERMLRSQSAIRFRLLEDTEGAEFNQAVNHFVSEVREINDDTVKTVVSMAKCLRWRRFMQPQPVASDWKSRELCEQLEQRCEVVRKVVANGVALDQLLSSAQRLLDEDSAVVKELRLLDSEDDGDYLLVVRDRSTATLIQSWLEDQNLQVSAAQDIRSEQHWFDFVHVLGFPRAFDPSIFSSPVGDDVDYVFPSWIHCRSLPESSLMGLVENPLSMTVHNSEILNSTIRTTEGEPDDGLSWYLPEPVWSVPPHDRSCCSSDLVDARQIYLSGGWETWLDDGERVRTLEIDKITGVRVSNLAPEEVTVGSYLLLREHESERGLLKRLAQSRIPRAEETISEQRFWKERLLARIKQIGVERVRRELRNLGVGAYRQVDTWSDMELIRPKSDNDFLSLLDWLDIPREPTFQDVRTLQSEVRRISHEITAELENQASRVNPEELERQGHMHFKVSTDGVRSMVATRVMAIRSSVQKVPKSFTRTLRKNDCDWWIG